VSVRFKIVVAGNGWIGDRDSRGETAKGSPLPGRIRRRAISALFL
jgi:hypothetical protein